MEMMDKWYLNGITGSGITIAGTIAGTFCEIGGKGGLSTFLTLKFGNHSLTPSNGLGIAATRLNTKRCALSSGKVFLLRPYSLING
jgi:hypothetical protein